jgi:hypothetical protein
MGSTPPRAVLFIGGSTNYPLRFLPPYNAPQRLYPENFTRRSRRIFRYDLNLSLGRQPKRQHLVFLMANHFASPHVTLI